MSLSVGDRVFGFDDRGSRSHAEYMTIKEDKVMIIPENISYEEEAASSEGAHYAYNFINKVDLKKGQDVLVNGATGAIGSATVQLLKSFDVNVTAVCSTKNYNGRINSYKECLTLSKKIGYNLRKQYGGF